MKYVWLIVIDNHNSKPEFINCSTEEVADSKFEEIISSRYTENKKEISEAVEDGFYESKYRDNVVKLKKRIIGRNLKITDQWMKNEDEEQIIYLINKMRNEYCRRYNCCFNKDHGYHYKERKLCPLCYNGHSNCMCEDILWRAFKILLTSKRPHRLDYKYHDRDLDNIW